MGDLVKATLKRIVEVEEQRTDTRVVRGSRVNKIEVGRGGISGSIIFHPKEWGDFTQAVRDGEVFHFRDETGMDVAARVEGDQVILDTGIHMGEVTVPVSDVLAGEVQREDSELQIYSTEPSGAMREVGQEDLGKQAVMKELDYLPHAVEASETREETVRLIQRALRVFQDYLKGDEETPEGPAALGPKVKGDFDFTTLGEGGVEEQEPMVEPLQEPEPAGQAETVAKAFHETYERLAPEFGYETRDDSAKPWDEVPEENKSLMIAVVRELLEKGVIEAGTPEEPPVEPEVEVFPAGGETEEM